MRPVATAAHACAIFLSAVAAASPLLVGEDQKLGAVRKSGTTSDTAQKARWAQPPPPPYAGPVTLCGEIPGAKAGETYLVTMAAVNATNASEIVSTFAAGVSFTVSPTTSNDVDIGRPTIEPTASQT